MTKQDIKEKIFTCDYCDFTALKYDQYLQHLKEAATNWEGHVGKPNSLPSQQIEKIVENLIGLDSERMSDAQFKEAVSTYTKELTAVAESARKEAIKEINKWMDWERYSIPNCVAVIHKEEWDKFIAILSKPKGEDK